MGLFFTNRDDNEFIIVKEIYAAGHISPDIGRIYTGFSDLDEAMIFAVGLAQNIVKSPNKVQMKYFGEDFGSVIVQTESGRYVYACHPALNVNAA